MTIDKMISSLTFKKTKDPAKQYLQSRRIAFFLAQDGEFFCNGRGRDGLRPNTHHLAAS